MSVRSVWFLGCEFYPLIGFRGERLYIVMIKLLPFGKTLPKWTAKLKIGRQKERIWDVNGAETKARTQSSSWIGFIIKQKTKKYV